MRRPMSPAALPAARRVFVLLGLVVPMAAGAVALPFRDGFETGDISAWEKTWLPAPENTLAAAPEAAKVGAFGLRLVDLDASAGPQGQNAVHIDFDSTFDALGVRTWIRMLDPAGQGSLTVISAPSGSGQAMLSVVVDVPSGAVSLASVGATTPFTEKPTGTSLQVGQWHLIEMLASGIGTATGQVRLWIDGEPRASFAGQEWSAMRPVGLNLGAHWSGGASTSIVDFDEVEVATKLPASRLRLLASATTFEADACTPLELQVATSNGTSTTGASTELAVQLTTTGSSSGATFFSTAECAAPIDTLLLPPSTQTAPLFVRAPFAGRLELEAHADELLPGRIEVNVDGPVARISPERQEIDPAGTATLDGSTSTGARTEAVAGWEWKLVQGPRGVAFSEGAVQSLSLEIPGRYEAQLIVVDAQGRKSLPTRAVIDVRGEPRLPDEQLRGCRHAPASAAFLFGLVAWRFSARRRRAGRAS